jgi:hypothetical protein
MVNSGMFDVREVMSNWRLPCKREGRGGLVNKWEMVTPWPQSGL